MLEMGISMFSFPWIMIMLKNYKKSRKYPRKWHCKFYFVDTFFVGHVGDGNFHILFLADPNIPKDLQQAKDLSTKVAE
jgi:hypothetical protein